MYELTRLEVDQGDSLAVVLRTQEIETDFAVVSGDSVATFIVAPRASFTYDSTHTSVMPAVICASYDVQVDSVGLTVVPVYRRPQADIWLTEGPVVNVKYSSMRTESTHVNLYVSGARSYTGRSVKRVAGNVVGTDGYARVDTMFQYSSQDPWLPEGDSLWFYAIIEDGVNPPIPTAMVGPYYLPPALSGSVTVTEGVDTVTSGLLVYVDKDGDGSWDTRSTGHVEIHGITGESGTFRIPALPQGTHMLRVVPPPGYTLLSDNLPVDTVSIQYSGAPLEIDLKLQPFRN
jgi:hypothetical protein